MHDDNVDVHVQAVEKFVAITQTTPSFARGFLEGFPCSLSKVFFLANRLLPWPFISLCQESRIKQAGTYQETCLTEAE